MASSDSAHAVFLSYASEDQQSAERLCAGLKSAGIEVWLDRSELRGGDAWDSRIRQQIKTCALFLPLISANTQARSEGYFRLEWKLAIDRSYLIAGDRAFLLPVVIDAIAERDARVPERFRDVQWTRLPGGTPTDAFVGRVTGLLSDTEGAAQQRQLDTSSVARAGRRTPRYRLWGVLALALAAATAVVVLMRRPLATFAAAVQVSAPAKSIAVLPLANSTGDTSNEYLSDGISEELIASLSHLRHLKVIGRTSSFQFKGKSQDSREIGAKLAVAYLLEGSVQRSADRLRVAVVLVTASDGATVWADTYDSQIKDLFALQTRIAGAVARQLNIALMGKDAAVASAAAEAGASENFDAYQALLQGNFYYQRSTAQSMQKALDYYTQAARLDPSYALAWARISITVTHLVGNYSSMATKEGQAMLATGRRAAETALSLDPMLADAHRARALLLGHIDFDFVGSQAEFRRAVELEPQNSGSIAGLANLQGVSGKLDEGVALTRRALILDPLNSGFHINLALLLNGQGRYEEAQETLRSAIALQPQAAQHYCVLAQIAILQGRSGEALKLARQETDPFWRTYALGLAHQAHGDRSEADAALQKLIAEDADDAGSQIASFYALRGDPDQMFSWLEHALETHDVGVTSVLIDPLLHAYRADPRFTAFARKLGALPKN